MSDREAIEVVNKAVVAVVPSNHFRDIRSINFYLELKDLQPLDERNMETLLG